MIDDVRPSGWVGVDRYPGTEVEPIYRLSEVRKAMEMVFLDPHDPWGWDPDVKPFMDRVLRVLAREP